MPKRSNLYTVEFVAIVAVVFSMLLALAASLLKERQDANVALDMKKNILKAMQLADDTTPPDKVRSIFGTRVTSIVVDHQGNVVEDADPAKIKPEDVEKQPIEEQRYPLYVLQGEDGAPAAYAIPIEGKGLWSTLYGYLSLEADLDTVRGITFYKHGETPGLGGEIEAAWFQKQFVGKQVYNRGGDLVSVTVVKGKAADMYDGDELTHYVDGISGATLTSRGVTQLLDQDLKKYAAYFERLRGKGDPNHG